MGFFEGGKFVVIRVDARGDVDEIDDPAAVDLGFALKLLEISVKEDLVAGDRLFIEFALALLAIGAIGAVDIDGARFVGDDHFAEGRVGHFVDGGRHIVAFGAGFGEPSG